jgi:prepilin-type N-terminal cleavage/methylation domain-containing protein
MPKKGFTLAEVLITLSIVGVVAALTLPALQLNIQKNKIGPAVAKAINTMTSVNQAALAEEGAGSLTSICEHYAGCLDKFATGGLQKENLFITSDGMEFEDLGYMTEQGNFGYKYSGTFYLLVLDINGSNKGPNEYGRDRFVFAIDSQGIVLAAGSYAFESYWRMFDKDEEEEEEANQEGTNWTKLCPNGESLSSMTEENKQYCTGSIVDNGYTVQYKL